MNVLAASQTCTRPVRKWHPGDLLELYRSRRALARLEAHHLADLGLSARDAHFEARRAPWDVPTHWRR